MKIYRFHEGVGICYSSLKLIGSELKDFACLACLERTRLQQPDEYEQNESDADFSLNISYNDVGSLPILEGIKPWY